MTNIYGLSRSIFAVLIFFSLLRVLPVEAGRLNGLSGTPQTQALKIPEAPESCETDECKWWAALRTAANEAFEAHERKEDVINKALAKAHQAGRFDVSERDVVPRDRLTNLYEEIARTSEKYLALLQEGGKKSYRVPVNDSPSKRPVIIRKRRAKYTEEARRSKIQGTVLLSLVYNADGKIGDIKVVRGLEKGLTEQAIEAAKYMLFVPAVKEGQFVSVRGNIEFNFSLY